LFSLLLYLAASIVSTVVVMAFVVPMMILPVFLLFLVDSAATTQTITTITLVISGLCMLIFIPVMAILMGWLMAFWQSAWALAYDRLTRIDGPAVEQTHA
jgi:hypothetical protein